MPNGEQAQEQVQEGADSAEESGDWQSPDDDDEEESDESDDEEEEVDSPPRTERRSKQSHDPAGGRNKVVALSTQVHKRTRTGAVRKGHQAAQGCPFKASEDLAQDQDGRSRRFCVSVLSFCVLLPTHTSALTEWVMNFSVLQLPGLPWILTRLKMMRRLKMWLLPKLVRSCNLVPVFVDWIVSRLSLYGCILCSPTGRH